MNFIYEKNRIYFEDSNNKILAEVTFPAIDNNTVEIDHTFVDSSLRGQGIADKLLRNAAEYLAENNIKIKPVCSYAVSWFSKNTEYKDLLV